MNKLGHYFRHLFHLYNLVDKQPMELEIDKIDFTRIVRTQMSAIEQLHLFFNIQSTFGQNWMRFEFVKKYKVFRNMPLPLAKIGVLPKEFLENSDIEYDDFFEWQLF
ncbi:putative phage abortive infection protein [Leptospira levettii]|uniref:putative phage abortive infection protein n=1 Tax=Leptospira levettii TaxID=2023178 RepID=UPI0013FE334E|nr:putative phage abortive infection protein [Leptospira levettii]MCW7475601.1 putative phage abortive infection protein [Leptospira levettii]